MKNYEISLVAFTVLSQTAVGLGWFGAWKGGKQSIVKRQKTWLAVCIIMGLAMLASLFHLGHPLSAPTALKHLGVSWLSREILVAGTFLCVAALAFLLPKNNLLPKITAFVGLGLLVAQGFTYAPVAQPAISNAFPMFMFMLTAWILGAIGIMFFYNVDNSKHLKTALGIWLVTLLLVPCLWASGSTILYLTAKSWALSAFYWAAVLFGIIALILLSRKTVNIYIAGACLFVGMVLARLTFFGDTVSTFNNIGAPF